MMAILEGQERVQPQQTWLPRVSWLPGWFGSEGLADGVDSWR
jgi:hypothetical protein